MIVATEINSTFYALRLLSHGLDPSEITISDGEEYPASEFTGDEQQRGLQIIDEIQQDQSISFGPIRDQKIGEVLTILASRIEELANDDLANAGYSLETTPEAATGLNKVAIKTKSEMLRQAVLDVYPRTEETVVLEFNTGLWLPRGYLYSGRQKAMLDSMDEVFDGKKEESQTEKASKPVTAKRKLKRKPKKRNDRKPKSVARDVKSSDTSSRRPNLRETS